MKTKLTPADALIELNRLKVNGYMPTDWERRCAAIEMAKDALRKQEPRKPVKIKSIQLGECFGCPLCEEILFRVKSDFCSDCGQALDWQED